MRVYWIDPSRAQMTVKLLADRLCGVSVLSHRRGIPRGTLFESGNGIRANAYHIMSKSWNTSNSLSGVTCSHPSLFRGFQHVRIVKRHLSWTERLQRARLTCFTEATKKPPNHNPLNLADPGTDLNIVRISAGTIEQMPLTMPDTEWAANRTEA
jgi:hypothetical protein